MPPSWLTLADDEEIQWWEHPSHLAYLPGYGIGFVIAAVGMLLVVGAIERDVTIGPVDGSVVAAGVVVAGVLILLYTYVRRWSTHYVLTTKQVYEKRGLLGRNVDPVRLDQVAEYEYSQSVLDRLFGLGEVRIMTAGTGGKDVVLEHVPSVQDFTAQLSAELDRTSEN